MSVSDSAAGPEVGQRARLRGGAGGSQRQRSGGVRPAGSAAWLEAGRPPLGVLGSVPSAASASPWNAPPAAAEASAVRAGCAGAFRSLPASLLLASGWRSQHRGPPRSGAPEDVRGLRPCGLQTRGEGADAPGRERGSGAVPTRPCRRALRWSLLTESKRLIKRRKAVSRSVVLGGRPRPQRSRPEPRPPAEGHCVRCARRGLAQTRAG